MINLLIIKGKAFLFDLQLDVPKNLTSEKTDI